MSIPYDELIEQAREQGESFELPEEVLEAIAGGLGEQERKAAIGFLVRTYKGLNLSLEESIALERDDWHRPQEDLDYMREIWDSVK